MEKKKKSKVGVVLIIIGAVIAFCIISCVIIGIIAKKLTESASLKKETAHPVIADIHSSVTTSGQITSGDITSYDTNISAKISEIKVKVGQQVKKGDVIMTFDTDNLVEQYEQATLSARSNQLANQANVEMSNKTSSSIGTLQAKVTETENQIKKVKQEISDLEGNLQNTDDTTMAVSAAIAEKQSAYADVLAKIQLLLDNAPAGTDVTATADYKNLVAERDALTASIEYMQAIVAADPNASISQAIAAKQTELANLEIQLEQQKSAVESAQAGVMTATQKEQINVANQLANLQVTSAATALDEGKAGIVAERDGIIQSIDTMKGSMTTPGMPLYSLANTNDTKITISLSSKDLEIVKLGQKADVTFLDNKYEGEVTYISRIATVDATGNNAIKAEITIKNPDDNLVYGLNAKVVIHTVSKENILTISSLAINVDKEGTFVYVIENGLIVKKPVEIGISDINNTEIISGIDEDSVVITNVDATVKEGMPAISSDPEEQANAFAALTSTTEEEKDD